ncbi:TetR/AcrR family transcriptional regulator [Mycolicibacterium monacense]|uniref:TetR family transcriptional regulator n=2 Tax=Mycobacteriaceae TaxID=1762 RepID=A0AAD1IY96_MYCMB|nr:TetR/AcrR family transcriptional regulator [Mycolicibacterium monacense]MDA4101924.1 TetR family transcriptional regulator [Mycolicibacterium monacense DSM 44395]OBF55767.1 TetR family transcriptional regulator [Mycolicibacterium monacense]ORB15557.1 TetR family transcriptional regulator [Mycolicibacterium monacense DSM 44395]QHP84862.1 TetR/AcrR family transcriptional regulator [Mycolicibacterium monacense DSM 44395]BBZ62323.1 TetR family transcriptional regulator [Mycolicibacterium monace
MSGQDEEAPLPRALELLWQEPPARGARQGGLSRELIVAAAIELADAEGLGALSMARLAERLNCGTMSLYRHIANKDELLTFMVSQAPGPPPARREEGWRAAVETWAHGLWAVYHRHRWILATASFGPPLDPGQLAWLDAGLAALAGTGLTERDKLAAVMAVLHFVRGAAALGGDRADTADHPVSYPAVLRRVVDAERLPALAAAVDAGVFDDADGEDSGFRAGLAQLLDGIAARISHA